MGFMVCKSLPRISEMELEKSFKKKEDKMTYYVLGFLFDKQHTEVVLIEKQRPSWQKGFLNGVGGHIEPNETPINAMRREFEEEADFYVQNWNLRVVLRGSGTHIGDRCRTGKSWQVYCFTAETTDILSCCVKTVTDEKLWVLSPYLSRSPLSPPMLSNLKWLIPLCLDNTISRPIIVGVDAK